MTAAALAPELAAALMPDESASAYLRRSAPVPVRTGLWFAPALRPGQAVEFVGPSGSGKTALLVQVRMESSGDDDDDSSIGCWREGIDFDSPPPPTHTHTNKRRKNSTSSLSLSLSLSVCVTLPPGRGRRPVPRRARPPDRRRRHL